MARHSAHIHAFLNAVQQDGTISPEEKGRQVFEAVDFLEEVLSDTYPDPRLEPIDDNDEDY